MPPAGRCRLIPDLEHGISPRLDLPERLWHHTGGPIDPWLTLLAALDLDAHALLGPSLACDFLGDQWALPWPEPADLDALYGLTVMPLRPWRCVHEHLQEQLGAGRLVMIETDAHALPDTAGDTYRRHHARTMVIVDEIDLAQRRLGYFHRAGHFLLQGEDFEAVAGPRAAVGAMTAIGVQERIRLGPEALRAQARQQLLRHRARMPRDNPVQRWERRHREDLARGRIAEGPEACRAWSDAGLRQLGAATELASAHLRWLAQDAADAVALLQAADALWQLSVRARALHLKGEHSGEVRALLDPAAPFEHMARHWQQAASLLGTVRLAAADRPA
ncbi:MAG: hypothetical protein QG612_1257 [Pseudomonadota bacterium]|nr:hypothetical protein [Pseudomonadota bacterium]